jgi:predicted 3-demethylubiquinone-9 3-methyltransferase (glyoxalase superfamily)
MPKITPFLWFDNQAEEAVLFYTSIFKNSKVLSISRMEVEAPGQPGPVISATFQLEGQEIMALNGGPHFKFTEAISLFVSCETQEEVDYYWDRLMEGGEAQMCGWLKDKYGLSWQIVPTILGQLLGDKDAEKAQRVMQAMLKMVKIDIAGLKQAYEQG